MASSSAWPTHTEVAPWASARTAHLASLSTGGVAVDDSRTGGGRVYDFHGMTPASSGHQLARIFAGRELVDTARSVADSGHAVRDSPSFPETAWPFAPSSVIKPVSFQTGPGDRSMTPEEQAAANQARREEQTQFPPVPGANQPSLNANQQPAQQNTQPGQNQQQQVPATTNPGTGKPVDDKTQNGPLPGQPIAPPAEPAASQIEGVPRTVPTNNGGTLTSTIVAGTGGQTVDSEVDDGHGNITRSRAVTNDLGGVTIWTAHADGKHSVTYLAGPGQENPGTTESFTYASAAAGDLANGPGARTQSDGRGNWLEESRNADGTPSVKLTQTQADGVTLYETERLPGGGTRTYARRPGDPEFSTPWLVGETKPDGSGMLTRIDGSTKVTRPDGSGTISGGLDGTTTNYGTDKWGQKYVQTYDPANDQIITFVAKDANTDKPWEEIITSDLKGGFEGHYRKGADGERELIWQMLADGYKLTPNELGGRNVEKNGVVEGVFISEQDGTLRFRPNQAYKDRTGAELTQEIVMAPGQGPKTLWGNGLDGDKRIDFRPLNTQHGEVPGMPWVGSEKGPIGQDYDSFAAKFGMAIINTYDGILPLIGQGGSSNQGFKEAWTALGKNVAKTAAIAVLTAQGGPGGYDLANSGAIPGLNKDEANKIVKDLANSLGYSDFKEGKIGAGLGTLLGALAAGSALGGLTGVVTRPLAAGARGVIGAAFRDGARAGDVMPNVPFERGLPHDSSRNTNHISSDGSRLPSDRGGTPMHAPSPTRPGSSNAASAPKDMAQTGTRPSSTISGLIEAGFRLWEIGYRDFNKALRSVVNNPRVVLSGIPNGFFDDFLAGATKYDAAATPGSRHRRPPTSRGAIAAADTHLPDGTVLKAGEHKIFIKGDVTYYLDKDGYPTAAVGYLNPPSDYKKSGVGHRPYPVGWIDDVDDRGHMIPEAGVRSKRDVNLDENLFSQQKTANGSPKKVWENAIIAYAKAHPGVMAQVTVLERYSSGRPKKAVYSLYDLSGNEIPGFRVTINNPRTLSKPPTTVPSSPIYPTP